MRKRTIKIVLILIVVILGVRFCDNAYKLNKNNHLHTEHIGNGIFKEKFETFQGGVLMTNDYSYYVTDSISFRKFVGEADEKELFKCQVFGDTIKAVKYSRRIHYGKETPIDSIYLSIKDLKKEGKFE